MGFAAGNEVEGIWGRVGCCVVPAKGRAGRQATCAAGLPMPNLSCFKDALCSVQPVFLTIPMVIFSTYLGS